MFNLLAILTILACGDKSDTDTGATVGENESTENGSNGSGENASGENGEGTTETGTEGGDPDADPNADADEDGFVGSEDCDDSDDWEITGRVQVGMFL